MESVRPKLKIQDVFAYIVAYAFWIIGAAIGLVTVFQTRNTLNTIWPVFGSSNQWRWTLRPIDRFGLLFMGLIWLVYVIFIEHYYRDGVTVLRFKRDGLHTSAPITNVPANAAMRFLHKLGLDVLVWRVVITIAPLVAVFVAIYLIQRLGFWLLAVVR